MSSRGVRVALMALCILAVAVTSLPMATAARCGWGYGPAHFECEGRRCIPGPVVVYQGGVGVGCVAWD